MTKQNNSIGGKSQTLKKWGKYFLIVLLCMMIVGYLFLMLFIGRTTRFVAGYYGPKLLGVSVEVQDVDVGMLLNKVTVRGVKIGNPEGFSNTSMLEIDMFKVKVDLFSLMKDLKVINEILIQDVNLVYETKLTQSNLGKLIENLEAMGSSEKIPQEQKTEETASTLKFMVEQINIEGVKVKVGFTQLGGKGAGVLMPPLHLKNVGKDENGISIVGLTTKILSSFFTSIKDSVLNIGSGVEKGVEKVGSGIIKGVKGLGDAIFGPSKQ